MTDSSDMEILRIQDLSPDADRAPVQFSDDGAVYRMASIRSMSFRDRSEHDHHMRRWVALQEKDGRKRLTDQQRREFEEATDALVRIALPDLPDDELAQRAYFEKQAVITAFRAAFLGDLDRLGKAVLPLTGTETEERPEPTWES